MKGSVEKGDNEMEFCTPMVKTLASSPGHSHVFNVTHRKEGGPGTQSHMTERDGETPRRSKVVVLVSTTARKSQETRPYCYDTSKR
jgi:hypothetical protein